MRDSIGLTIIGVHGLINTDSTPHVYAGVFVDSDGEMISPETGWRKGVFISKDGPLPGCGTRIRPLPAYGDEIVFSVRQHLLVDAAKALNWRATMSVATRDWIEWAIYGTRDADVLCSRRLDDVCLWVASPSVLLPVREMIRDFAVRELRACVKARDNAAIERMAWTLQRAELTTEDTALACAGLLRAGKGRRIVDELMWEVNAVDRKSMLEAADEMLS